MSRFLVKCALRDEFMPLEGDYTGNLNASLKNHYFTWQCSRVGNIHVDMGWVLSDKAAFMSQVRGRGGVNFL